MIEWKKMSEEQPKEEGEYLVCITSGEIDMDMWYGPKTGWAWFDLKQVIDNVTHWAEINKPEE